MTSRCHSPFQPDSIVVLSRDTHRWPAGTTYKFVSFDPNGGWATVRRFEEHFRCRVSHLSLWAR